MASWLIVTKGTNQRGHGRCPTSPPSRVLRRLHFKLASPRPTLTGYLICTAEQTGSVHSFGTTKSPPRSPSPPSSRGFTSVSFPAVLGIASARWASRDSIRVAFFSDDSESCRSSPRVFGFCRFYGLCNLGRRRRVRPLDTKRRLQPLLLLPLANRLRLVPQLL